MVAALEQHFPAGEIVATGASSGTHVFLRLPHVPVEETERLLDAARDHGVYVYSGLAYYQVAPRTATLLLGYTTVGVEDIELGVARLAKAYRQ